MHDDAFPSFASIVKPAAVLFIGAGFLLTPITSQASTGIFEMSDGSFYHPASGMSASTRQTLEDQLVAKGIAVEEKAVTQPNPVVTSAEPAPATRVLNIFRMSDGRYFHPASGMLASSEAEIYAAEGLSYPPVGEAVTDPTRNTPLIRAVDRAKRELEERIKRDEATYGIKTTPTDDIWADVTLAVWNKATDEIRYVDAKKRGTSLEIASGNEDIFVRNTNYINSEYAIKDPNSLVVAVRYPILESIEKNGVVAHYELHDEAYAPYSRDVHTPEAIEAGESYLNRTIDKAFDEMKSASVPSRAYLGQQMADVVDKDLIKSILTIEHSDLWTLQNDPKYAVERVLVTLGLNTEDTYNYSRSSAGAFGLAQFIPSTYASFAARTHLGLIPEFEKGLKDHVNAVRATAAHLDDSLASLPSSVRVAGMNDDKVKEYLAAAYNGGYSKVRTAIQIWDEQISGVYAPHEIRTRSRLYPETINYVKKLRQALPVFQLRSEQVQLAADTM